MPNDGMSDDSAYDPTRDDRPIWLGPGLTSAKPDTWQSRDEFKNRSVDVMTAAILWAVVLAVVIFLLGGAVALTMAVFF